MSDPYRDHLTAVRERVETLRGEATRLEARVTDALRALAPELAAAPPLDLLRPAPATPEALEALERALELRVSALRDAVAGARRLETEALALPTSVEDPPPAEDLEPFTEDERELLGPTRELVQEELRTLDRHASARLLSATIRGRFKVDGAPFVLDYLPHRLPVSSSRTLEPAEISARCLTLATSVPRAAPELRLHPRALVARLFASSHATGDHSFDRRFVVEAASGEAACTLLTAPVREGLLAILNGPSPLLAVAAGRAELQFTSPELEPAVQVLLALRRAPLQLQLLRAEPG